MAVKVRILADSGYKFDRRIVRSMVERVLSDNGVKEPAEVVVSVVGEKKMKRLHGRYMQTKGTTDVLSFPLDFDKHYPDGVVRLGDIVVCYPVAARQAQISKRSVNEEITFLVEHGCRHLLGIHHS